MSPLKVTNLIAGPLMLGFGLLGVFVIIPNGIDEPGGVQFAALSPSYFPRIVCYMLAAFGALVIVRTLLAKPASSQTDADAAPDERVIMRTVTVFAVLLALYVALEPLGFPLTGCLALLVLMFLADERRLAIMLPIAVGIPAGLYLFFVKAANVPIPSGILEPYLVGG